MTVHALAGLPRSGSTLLATILDQHPDLHVAWSSALAHAVQAIRETISREPEVQIDLADPAAHGRYQRAIRHLIDAWHDQPTVLDKSRVWLLHPQLLASIDPDAQLVVTVRDPRDVIASIERAHRATAEFASPLGTLLTQRVEALMVPGGQVGKPCAYIEDLIRTRPPNITFVRYEALTAAPDVQVPQVASVLGLTEHIWDYEALDHDEPIHDAQWRGKWPHRVHGPVKAAAHHWSDVIPDDIAARIAASYPLYMSTFGYGG